MKARMSVLLLKGGVGSFSVKSCLNVCCQRFQSQMKYFSTQLQPDIGKREEPAVNISGDEVKSKNPLDHPDYFNVKSLVRVEDLLNARVHFGHKEGSLDERMKPFIFGSRLGHLIFDLDKTAEMFRTALNITAHVAYRGGIILFVSQYPQHSLLIERTAKECEEFAHTRVWRRGLFTNSTMMYGAVTRLPDLCIFLNTLTTVLDQNFALMESAKLLIPTVGVVDSNCNPNLITYPIPGNDDSAASIELYCKLFKEAILRGKRERQKAFDEHNRQLEMEK